MRRPWCQFQTIAMNVDVLIVVIIRMDCLLHVGGMCEEEGDLADALKWC